MKYSSFIEQLRATETIVSQYIFQNAATRPKINPPLLEDCTLSYLKRGGKKLRPAVLILACEVVGGDSSKALPAAAAVELFHTWTLVHDDIIDNDDTRRGIETVHASGEKYARQVLQFEESAAKKYGIDVGILTGDIQHGWSIAILAEDLLPKGVPAEVALHLISILQNSVLRTLVEGEMLDVDYSLSKGIDDIDETLITDMLWRKTGVLYEFCGIAGAMIGKGSTTYDTEVIALKEFCSLCGTAFQIKDDILGLIGNSKELGKPVGADIREGKKTLLVKEALGNANESERTYLLSILGKKDATYEEVQKMTKLVVDLGGVDKAYSIAQKLVNQALPQLESFKDSKSKEILYQWAHYMIDRTV